VTFLEAARRRLNPNAGNTIRDMLPGKTPNLLHVESQQHNFMQIVTLDIFLSQAYMCCTQSPCMMLQVQKQAYETDYIS